MSATLIIVVLTIAISFSAFNNGNLIQQLIFYPYWMRDRGNQIYRFVSHGFVHADTQHLIFNMITLFSFGSFVEQIFGPKEFFFFYIVGIISSSLVDYQKNKNNSNYRSLGASGGTSAVIFAAIVYQPWLEIWLVPGFIFGIIYLAYSTYAANKNNDNIGHEAHLYGALFGIAYVLLTKEGSMHNFIEQVTNPSMYYHRMR